MTDEPAAEMLDLLCAICRAVGGRIPRPAPAPMTPEQRRRLVSGISVDRSGRQPRSEAEPGDVPPSGGRHTPDEIFARRDNGDV
jgi:hypothetical protein